MQSDALYGMPAVRFDACFNPTRVTDLHDSGDLRCLLLRITFWAVGVLETEASFMAFSHLGPIERQQIVVGEHLNAVVVPKEGIITSVIWQKG